MSNRWTTTNWFCFVFFYSFRVFLATYSYDTQTNKIFNIGDLFAPHLSLSLVPRDHASVPSVTRFTTRAS